MLRLRRAAVRVSVDNATVTMPGVTDYLADILQCLEGTDQTQNAIRDALEVNTLVCLEGIAHTLNAIRDALEAK